jgi:hypothetical protein
VPDSEIDRALLQLGSGRFIGWAEGATALTRIW